MIKVLKFIQVRDFIETDSVLYEELQRRFYNTEYYTKFPCNNYKPLLQLDYLAKVDNLKKLEFKLDDNVILVLLKGTGLNGYLYPAGFERGTNDIDIFTFEENLDHVRNILKEKHTKFSTSKPFSGNYEETWIKGVNSIDLHWHLSLPELFEFHKIDIKNHLTKHDCYKKFKVLSPELNIVYLLSHSIKDQDIHTHHSIIDLINLINNKNVDLIAARNIAKKIGIENTYNYVITEYSRKGLINQNYEVKNQMIRRFLLSKSKKITILKKKNKTAQFFAYIIYIDSPLRVLKYAGIYLKKLINLSLCKLHHK